MPNIILQLGDILLLGDKARIKLIHTFLSIRKKKKIKIIAISIGNLKARGTGMYRQCFLLFAERNFFSHSGKFSDTQSMNDAE